MTIGKPLANGAILLQCAIATGLEKCLIVLCSWKNGTEYVTWTMDQHENTFWGHYNDTKEQGVADFNRRIARGY